MPNKVLRKSGQLHENINFFTLLFAWPTLIANTAARQLTFFVRGPETMISDSGEASPPKKSKEGVDTIGAEASFARVAQAIARFKSIHCDNEPYTPDELRIIQTPLGLEAR